MLALRPDHAGSGLYGSSLFPQPTACAAHVTRSRAVDTFMREIMAAKRVSREKGPGQGPCLSLSYLPYPALAPGEGFEYHLLAIGLAAVVLVKGAGAWSIDGRLARR